MGTENYRRLKPEEVEVGDVYVMVTGGTLIRPYRILSVNDEGFVCRDPDPAYKDREIEVSFGEFYDDVGLKGLLIKQKDGGLEVLADNHFLDDLNSQE